VDCGFVDLWICGFALLRIVDCLIAECRLRRRLVGLDFGFGPRQFPLINPQSTNPQSTMQNPQSTITQSAIYNLQLANPQLPIANRQ
jgi:hypothetical protein